VEQDPDAWEQAARIVEAFEASADEQTAEVLWAASQAIRDRAFDD
jgi:vacuolar-type H+-ATPase subunit H